MLRDNISFQTDPNSTPWWWVLGLQVWSSFQLTSHFLTCKCMCRSLQSSLPTHTTHQIWFPATVPTSWKWKSSWRTVWIDIHRLSQRQKCKKTQQDLTKRCKNSICIEKAVQSCKRNLLKSSYFLYLNNFCSAGAKVISFCSMCFVHHF